mgnify:CR=1 FL=1
MEPSDSGGLSALPEFEREQGLCVAITRFAGCTEHFLSAQARGNESAADVFARAAAYLARNGAEVVSQEVIGFSASERDAFDKAFPEAQWPVTWLTSGAETGPHLAGTQIWAASNAPVTPVTLDKALAGRCLETSEARYVRLGGVLPADTAASRETQARNVFSQMNTVLDGLGLTFHDVARTWFYNDQIVSWYEPFNQVRYDCFREWEVLGSASPASTGIGAANADACALTGGLLAVDRRVPDLPMRVVPSPLQCPAFDYGSAFSRAFEIETPSHRRVLVSGTASIAPGGDTMHIGDTEKQMARTFEVVGAILASRGMAWNNVVRLLAYLKDARDYPVYDRFMREQGYEQVPALVVNCDICRDDLLFEIEVDALARG